MASVSIPFNVQYAIAGYTPTGHKLKCEIYIIGLNATEPVVKFTKTNSFVVGNNTVSGTISIDQSELPNLANGAINNLTLHFDCFQIDASNVLVAPGGASASAEVPFKVQVVNYADVTVLITSPTSGQVFTITV